MGMHECFCKVPHTGTCLVFLFNGLFFGVFDMRRWWRMQRCQEYMWIWSLVDMRTWLFMHECFCKVPHTGTSSLATCADSLQLTVTGSVGNISLVMGMSSVMFAAMTVFLVVRA